MQIRINNETEAEDQDDAYWPRSSSLSMTASYCLHFFGFVLQKQPHLLVVFALQL